MKVRICFARQGRMLLAGCLAGMLGCQSLERTTEQIAALAAREDSTSREDESDPASLKQPDSLRTSKLQPDSKAAEITPVNNALASAGWVATVARSDGTPPATRWRHPLIEVLPPEKHLPELRLAKDSSKPIAAANAMIVLARCNEPVSRESLASVVQQRQLPLPVRLAAVEALGSQLAATSLVHKLLDEFAPKESYAKAHYLPELHAELIYALAGSTARDATSPTSHDHDASLTAAIASPAPMVRLASLRVWLAIGHAPVPQELLDRRTDADPRVRVAALQAIGKWPPPQAREYLESATRDHDLSVRLAAIDSLGQLTDKESLDDLKRLQLQDAEFVRAAATTALVKRGQMDVLNEAATDDSWQVRLAAARLLGDHRPPQALTIAASLLNDASPQVQQQMAVSLGSWPLEQAGPLLLSAMGQSGFLIRKKAQAELAKRWSAAEDFAIDAPVDSRRTRLAALHRQWEAEKGLASQVGPDPVEVPAETGALSDLVAELKSPDIQHRRRAADRLVKQAAKAPLNDEAAAAVCAPTIVEIDALVWRSILTALSENHCDSTTRLVYAGLSHPAADVRRRACEHLRRHPDSRHGELLLKSLDDTDPVVIRAALAALAKCETKLELAPVEQLLSASDRALRVDAAVCLVRLGHAGGHAALERLSHDADPAIRRHAAVAMGQLKEESSLPTLMRLLDDQGGVREAALASLTEIAGQDMARTGYAEPPSNSLEEVRRWRTWHQSRR